jgi:hypothetical protein
MGRRASVRLLWWQQFPRRSRRCEPVGTHRPTLTRDTQSLHRIDPEVIKREVTAAGFALEGESNALMNPSDNLAARSSQGAPQVMLCFSPAWTAVCKTKMASTSAGGVAPISSTAPTAAGVSVSRRAWKR